MTFRQLNRSPVVNEWTAVACLAMCWINVAMAHWWIAGLCIVGTITNLFLAKVFRKVKR